MVTLGFKFNPWTDDRTIAHGDTILTYLQSTAIKFGIDKRIRYSEKVTRAEWNSKTGRYAVDVLNVETNEIKRYSTHFLFMCTGYYDYENPYTPPEFESLSDFKGHVIHPQHWTLGPLVQLQRQESGANWLWCHCRHPDSFPA